MGEFAIGQPVPRFEDPRLVRGGGQYVDDIVLPRMAFGYVLRSPHAHAHQRDRHVEAKAAPGVLAVLTGEDWTSRASATCRCRRGPSAATARPSTGRAIRRWCKDRVRWVGDYVAFVVAETKHQAQDAAELIEVDYEPLPAIDRRPPTPSSPARRWSGTTARTTSASSQLDGDKAATDAAFASAAHVVKQRLVINRVTADTMEPRGSIGDYNADRRTATRSTRRSSARIAFRADSPRSC